MVRNDDPVGADIQNALGYCGIPFLNANDSDSLASDGGSNVFGNLFPTQMAMFGIDDDIV